MPERRLVSVVGVYGGFVDKFPMTLDDAPRAYELFKHNRDGCVKVVLRP